MSIRGQLRGFEGVQSRMAELQAKLDRLQQKQQSPYRSPISTKSSNFESALSGAIDKSGKPAPSLLPFDPVSAGLINPTGNPISGKEGLQDLASSIAGEYGLDPELFQALIRQESGFDPSARSSAGAMGLTQLMPKTAKSLGVTDPYDPVQNLRGGAKYLSQMLREFNGDVSLALAAYNAGPGAVRRAGGIPPFQETRNYVKKILSQLSGGN